MPPSKGSVRGGAIALEGPDPADLFKKRENGVPYSSAGGGEVSFDGTLGSFFRLVRDFMKEEHDRPNYSNITVIGPDLHSRPPAWLEGKHTAIDGTPLTEVEREAPNLWANKYRKELDVAEAVQEVRQQRRNESTNEILGLVNRARRFFGFASYLDEEAAKAKVHSRYLQEAEARRLREVLSSEHPVGALPRCASSTPSVGADQVEEGGATRTASTLKTPWLALLESIETGRPLTKVASEYRPRVDYYGLDPFLDSAPSLMWFSTKCGIAIGLVHGTAKAVQAMNVDVQFLRASGVGVLSILNMSVFASVVKWGGNAALFAGAFCAGDRLMRRVKCRVLPPHDARCRSTSNYVVGLAFSGAMVGVLPWWVLSDTSLAVRMAASGLAVGGVLGLLVGVSIQRLVALNTSRLDATNRQLRRYEALLLRERSWAEKERTKHTSSAYVWW